MSLEKYRNYKKSPYNSASTSVISDESRIGALEFSSQFIDNDLINVYTMSSITHTLTILRGPEEGDVVKHFLIKVSQGVKMVRTFLPNMFLAASLP